MYESSWEIHEWSATSWLGWRVLPRVARCVLCIWRVRSTASQQPSHLQVADRKRGILEQARQLAFNNLRRPDRRAFINDQCLISGAQRRLLDRLETRSANACYGHRPTAPPDETRAFYMRGQYAVALIHGCEPFFDCLSKTGQNCRKSCAEKKMMKIFYAILPLHPLVHCTENLLHMSRGDLRWHSRCRSPTISTRFRRFRGRRKKKVSHNNRGLYRIVESVSYLLEAGSASSR